MKMSFFSFDTDDDEISMHKTTKDSDLKKKKHKKHKKHKKSGKVDKLDKDLHAKKKHKKQHKRNKHRESEDSSSDVADKLPTKNAPTSLSSKFTEIMKTNGHSTTTGLAAKLIKSIKKPAVPTDPTALVEMITQSLDPNAPPSLEIVSSESESDGAIQDVDVDSPDVAVIEDELNLEELMKQKALLQARLGNIASESEEERPVDSRIETKPAAPNKISDVILLDDSSGEVLTRTSSTKKRQRSASLNRDRNYKRKDERRESSRDRFNREQDKMKQRRSDDNRNKEDLRREIDRDKERCFRDRRRDGGGRADGRFNRDRNRYSIDGDRRGNQRSRSRDRYDRDDRGRDRDRGNRKREEKNDKFVGSLSEGQKVDKESSSESDYGDIKVNEIEEDDEEKIIEMRRKKREELMKKLATSQAVSQREPGSNRSDSDEDVVFVQNEEPADEKTLTPVVPITTAPKQVSPPEPVVIENFDDIESTTPPLPVGMLKLAAKVTQPELPTKTEDNVTNEEGNDNDLINHDKVNKIKEATKRSEWDMFAEQDNYSNFDVSIFCSVNKFKFHVRFYTERS